MKIHGDVVSAVGLVYFSDLVLLASIMSPFGVIRVEEPDGLLVEI